METNQFEVSLNSKNANEQLKTHLKIPENYEFSSQINEGIKYQTNVKDDFCYVHERYDQYYKGIKIEHSDIRARYLDDALVSINGEYIVTPYIDVSIVLTKEMAIQKAIEHIGAKKIYLGR